MGEYPYCSGIGGWLRSVWEQNIERRRRESILLRLVEQAVDVADPVIRLLLCRHRGCKGHQNESSNYQDNKTLPLPQVEAQLLMHRSITSSAGY